jgi:hypothetical protein
VKALRALYTAFVVGVFSVPFVVTALLTLESLQ